ncbi:MAG: hypothetical protein SNJ29_07135 [Rikenellaceae bacterium]
MRREAYQAIKERLQRLVVADSGEVVVLTEQALSELKEGDTEPNYAIKHIRLWNRQVEYIEGEIPFQLPAIFIEFGEMVWQHKCGGTQFAPVQITLHVLSSAVIEGYPGDTFHLDLLDSINICLHGMQSSSIGSLARVSSQPCHDHEEILDNIEVFEAIIYDSPTLKSYTAIEVDINLDLG